MPLPITDYEKNELKKFKTLIEMAQDNGNGCITMQTDGVNPHMRFQIKAYVLAKFIKDNA